MQNIRLIIILVLSLSVIYWVTAPYGADLPESQATLEKTQVMIGNTVVYAEIADTPILREQGLSGRENLKDNEGMLFIFGVSARPGFWMKKMLFPIDIIWISDSDIVADISENLSPSSYPRIFSPKTEIKYVLEVPSGFVEKNKVKIGDRMIVR